MRSLNTQFKHTLLHPLAVPVILGLVVSIATFTVHRASKRSASSNEAITPAASIARDTYGRIPLSFETNQGQTDASVNFLARGAGYTLFLKPTEAVFALSQAGNGARTQNTSEQLSAEQAMQTRRGKGDDAADATSQELTKVLRMKLVGADSAATVEGLNDLEGKANYFVGGDQSQWLTSISTFGRVRYSQVYPGIDLLYYGNQRQLEYDFVVAPGRDVRAVQLRFEGANRVEIDATGDLLLTLDKTVMRQPKPFVYQEVGGARLAVEGGYALGADGQVGFNVGEYDAQRPLIIDPVLVYSTYLGGSGNDSVRDIAVDSAGNAYTCGETTSTNFPTANAFDSTFNVGNTAAARDAFVTKLNAAGTALVYSTYLGGTGNSINLSGDDVCTGIAIDSAGNAYVAGETRSTDFPTANALQGTFGGGLFEGFLTKLNAAGSALVYSTYIGGNNFDSAASVAVDSSGSAYVAGRTTSTNFATVNPIQATFAGGGSDAFIIKLNAAGSAIVYSTYLGGGGGNGFDAAFSIALDSSNNAYITGPTISTDFPTANAIQATFGGGTDGDAFVAKLNAAGSALVYSTYLGGSAGDLGADIAVDSSGNAHVTGTTSSSNFPTANAFDSTLNGLDDAFVTKLNAAGSAFVYSTYFGSTGSEAGNDIALDSSANAYVAGGTASLNLQMVNPTQGVYGGGSVDGFVIKFNPSGSTLLFSTYIGGNALDRGNAIAVDTAGSIYVAGITGSTNFPTLNPLQATNGGADDAFVTKISDPPATTSTVQFNQASYGVIEEISSVNATVTRSGDTSSAATVDYASSDGTANERGDYTTVLGTIRFAAGQTEATVPILISEDSFSEGTQSFTLSLLNPTGGAGLGPQATVPVHIADDAIEPVTSVNDDSTLFVGQHYHDFLNRQSDPAGLAFWVNQIESCGGDAQCREAKRINVSAAFFLSIEFQQTGYFVIRCHKSGFGDTSGNPAYRPFLRDTQEIGRGVVVGAPGADALLEANKQAFAVAFVQRADFQAAHGSQNADQYVDSLFANTGATPTASERAAAITAFASGDTAGRAAALRSVIRTGSVINKLYNPALVLMQYFGYLRRNPNDAPDGNFSGYDFWLNKMNQFSVAGEDVRDEQVALGRIQRSEMVKSFLVSGEYRGRFGP